MVKRPGTLSAAIAVLSASWAAVSVQGAFGRVPDGVLEDGQHVPVGDQQLLGSLLVPLLDQPELFLRALEVAGHALAEHGHEVIPGLRPRLRDQTGEHRCAARLHDVLHLPDAEHTCLRGQRSDLRRRDTLHPPSGIPQLVQALHPLRVQAKPRPGRPARRLLHPVEATAVFTGDNLQEPGDTVLGGQAPSAPRPWRRWRPTAGGAQIVTCACGNAAEIVTPGA
jgi:hypothetical protein